MPLSPLAVAPDQRSRSRVPATVRTCFRLHQETVQLRLTPPRGRSSRARPELGLAHFRVHDLRRTVATGMACLGINPHTISLVLDHISATKGTVTGAVYVKYSFDREKREALERWATQLEAIIRSSQTVAGRVRDTVGSP